MSSKEQIYHLSHRNLSRVKYDIPGRVAYSTGIEINDERTGKSYHEKSKQIREGIETEMILNEAADEKFKDTNYYYNKVNNSEKRIDARVFNEMDIALFNELSTEENKELARQFCKDFADKYKTPVSLSFHKLDSHNPHAHVIYCEREVEGENLSKQKIKEMRSRSYLKTPRAMWSERANKYFAERDKELFIDHRSFKERGLNKQPQTRYNKHSEIQDYKVIRSYNKVIKAENKALEHRQMRKEILLETQYRFVQQRNRREEVKRMAQTQEKPKMVTLHRLYENEIEAHEKSFLKSREDYKKQREANKEKRGVYRQYKELHKQRQNESKRNVSLKKGDILDLRLKGKELKSELKSHSLLNPFTWGERKKVKHQIRMNKIKQKRKKMEIKKEKAKQRIHKNKLKEKRKDYMKDKKKEFGLVKKQVVSKLKAKALKREKANVVNKKLDTSKVVSLKEYKKTHKVERQLNKEKERSRSI